MLAANLVRMHTRGWAALARKARKLLYCPRTAAISDLEKQIALYPEKATTPAVRTAIKRHRSMRRIVWSLCRKNAKIVGPEGAFASVPNNEKEKCFEASRLAAALSREKTRDAVRCDDIRPTRVCGLTSNVNPDFDPASYSNSGVNGDIFPPSTPQPTVGDQCLQRDVMLQYFASIQAVVGDFRKPSGIRDFPGAEAQRTDA